MILLIIFNKYIKIPSNKKMFVYTIWMILTSNIINNVYQYQQLSVLQYILIIVPLLIVSDSLGKLLEIKEDVDMLLKATFITYIILIICNLIL